MNQLWSWGLAALGLTGLWLAGTGARVGWAVGAAAQIVWAAYAVHTGQYGFLATACAYMAVYLRNYHRSRIVSTADTAPGPPAAVIFDLDGTLCLRTVRKPYDESPGAVLTDTPHAAVVEAALDAHAHGNRILLTTGRRERCRADTQQWLDLHLRCRACPDHGAVPYELFMRADGDGRKDSVVKLNMYRQHIFGRYRIVRVYDDRQQVVDMWRGLGLTCMQVAPGDF